MSCFGELKWVTAGRGSVPEGAIEGGSDMGEPVFVARAELGGDLIPGKLHRGHGLCYVPWGCHEHSRDHFEVLVNTSNCKLTWVRARGGEYPTGAIQGGRTYNGEPLFIGRATHNGATVIGKIQPSHRLLYVPYGGSEIPKKEYEVLTLSSLDLDRESLVSKKEKTKSSETGHEGDVIREEIHFPYFQSNITGDVEHPPSRMTSDVADESLSGLFKLQNSTCMVGANVLLPRASPAPTPRINLSET